MADNNEQLSFEFAPKKTIKGYPELHWTGKRPFKSTVYYPAQLKEQHGEAKPFTDANGRTSTWLNKIFWGDNLQVMSHLLRDFRGRVDLIYIDPPFDSKADYKKKIQLKGQTVTNDSTAFEEKQYGDIWTNDEYLQFMYERLTLIKELLSEKGTLYLHCDYRKSHQLRCVLDSIFGMENFRNEITWRRQIPRGMKVYAEYYAFSADYLLIYSKNATQSIWNRQVKYTKLTIAQAEAKYQRDAGGFFRTSDPGSYTFDSLVELHKNGRIYAPKNGEVVIDYEKKKVYASNGGSIGIKYYREERDGFVLEENTIDNIWDDIPGMGIVSSEFIGYPTQKPEGLLKRVIEASTNIGDLVFDCFMGSGTTQAVALKLGRRFIGADINLGAVQTTTKRLLKIAAENSTPTLLDETPLYTGFEVYNVNNYDIFRNPLEARSILLQALEVEPFESSSVYDGEKDGRMVKILPADVNRIATKADLDGFIANLPYKTFERRKEENPNEVVLKLTVVCMGHEPDLAAAIKQALSAYRTDVEVVDILTDRKDLQFKRDAQGQVEIEGGKLVIQSFYPLNLMQKLSMQRENVDEWRQLVESIMIDFNYDGAVLSPAVIDIPEKNGLVKGVYEIPEGAGKIKVKITDLLSESLELETEVK